MNTVLSHKTLWTLKTITYLKYLTFNNWSFQVSFSKIASCLDTHKVLTAAPADRSGKAVQYVKPFQELEIWQHRSVEVQANPNFTVALYLDHFPAKFSGTQTKNRGLAGQKQLELELGGNEGVTVCRVGWQKGESC